MSVICILNCTDVLAHNKHDIVRCSSHVVLNVRSIYVHIIILPRQLYIATKIGLDDIYIHV
jgi:hypothetical protein